MLTQEGCRIRRDRLWARLHPKPDALIVFDPQQLCYLANYVTSPFTFRANDAGAALVLLPDGRCTLVADNLLEPYVQSAFVDDVMAPVWYRSVESPPHREGFLVKNTANVARKALRSGRCRLGVEMAQVPIGLIEALNLKPNGVEAELIDLDPHLAALKRKKDADELTVLNRSMRAGEAGFAAAQAELKPGMTEMDLYLIVCRAAMATAGGQAMVYGDFVAGPRTGEGGGPPSRRKVEKGDLVILDFSTVIGQYRADFANTFIVDGQPSARQQDLAAACLDAMAAGEKSLKAGMPGKEVYAAVRRVFESKHLEGSFPHHAGHGIGVGHPEAPFLVPQSSETLAAGDVVTLEPGLYFKDEFGMRFERNYLITEDGYELLSKHKLGLT